MLKEYTVTLEELLDKLGVPVSWFRENGVDEKRERYIMDQLQAMYPGKYRLEEYYSPESRCFKYRLKFDSEADEMWFRLKHG